MPVITVKPNPANKVEGKVAKVFDPVHNDFLPDEGRMISLTTYWVNRLRNGEIIRVEQTEDPNIGKLQALQKLKAKKAIIEFAAENISKEFAESLDKQKTVSELKTIVSNELELQE